MSRLSLGGGEGSRGFMGLWQSIKNERHTEHTGLIVTER
jgi:hypothetical protein